MKVGSSGAPPRVSTSTKVTGPRRLDGVQRVGSMSAYGGTAEPVSALGEIEDRIEILGINPAELNPRVRDTLMMLMEEVDGLKRQLESTSARLREMEELADLDVLLPIRNRRAFVRELQRMMSFAERYGTPSTVMFIDMNDMKDINDKYGHEVGDQALFHLAQIVTENIRGTDIVGRLGGDEFGVILAQADEVIGQEKAAALANAILSTPMALESGDIINLKLAYGTHTFRGGEEAGAALEKADQAMYAHKKEIKGPEGIR